MIKASVSGFEVPMGVRVGVRTRVTARMSPEVSSASRTGVEVKVTKRLCAMLPLWPLNEAGGMELNMTSQTICLSFHGTRGHVSFTSFVPSE